MNHVAGEHLSDDEAAEKVIDWLEESGFALQPWQAYALRAILLQPNDARIVMDRTIVQPCPCTTIRLTYDWRCSKCGALHKAAPVRIWDNPAFAITNEDSR